MRTLFLLLPFFISITVKAQVIADFSTVEEVCKDESIELVNESINATNYEWDLCVNDLIEFPTNSLKILDLPFTRPFIIEMITDDGSNFAFILGRDNNHLYRLDFEGSFKNHPKIIDLGNPSNLLDGPVGISFIKEVNTWFALVVNLDNSSLIRLNFGSSIANSPTAEDLSNLNELTNPDGIEIVSDSGKLFAIIPNKNKLTVLDFGNSILNTPSAHSIIIANSNRLWDLELQFDGNNWHGLLSSFNNGKLFHLDFGNTISSSFNYSEIMTAPPELKSPAGVELLFDGINYYGFIQSRSGSIFRLAYGNNLNNNTPTVVNIGNLGGLLGTDNAGFQLIKEKSLWVGFSLNFGQAKLFRFELESLCSTNDSYSKEVTPIIRYKESGTYPITLTATDEDGNSSSVTKQITVLDQQAPQIAIQTDANLCLDNAKTFTAQNLTPDQTLTSLTWNFGDGTTTTGTEVTHQYTTPRTYKVRLTVEADGGCGNFIEKEVNIYETPEPEFSFPAGVLCTNGTITFENTTLGEYNDDITWTWDFGDGTTSAEKNPSHTYATGGTKTVTLKASIPGCEATVSHELEVIPGPSVDFSASNLCFGEAVQFTNLSTGNSITDYAWDFGNGETSTAENPTVTYAAAGTYEVSLTVNNTSGCSNTLAKSVVIHSLPTVDFDHALVCSGSPTPFEDRSTVEDGSISSWFWDFGEGTVSTEKNPVHVFVEPGTYEVKLKATSSWGCIDSTKQTVLVKASPKADFIVERGCPGTTSRFIDTSIIPEDDQIVKRVWVINSASFFSENPEIKFSLPGTYSATLTVTSSNGCQSSVTKSIVIDPLPEADFNYQNACVGEKTIFTDLSQAFGDDEIIGWQWQFGNIATSNEQHPEVTFPNAGNLPITLTVTTDRGCTISAHKTVTVSALPRAAFTTQTSLGAPPLRVNFKNNTSGAVSYQWLFGDPANSTSTEENPTFVYTTLGEYEAKLIATNAAGCTDTASMMIKTLIPKLEVALEQLNTFNTSGDLQLVLKITNEGSITIEDMDIALDLGGQLKVKERFSGSIAAGESINYPLSFEILKENLVRVPYVCASLSIVNASYSEENLENNSACKDIAEEFVLLTPFPNPVNGTFYVNFVMPEKAPVRLLIADMLGETVVDKALQDAKVGFNSYDFDFSSLTAGMYVIKLIHGDQTHLRKVVVR